MFFGVDVSCRILYSSVGYVYVSGSGSITSVVEERELICLLLFTCKYVVSVRRGFLFLWLLGMGCVILLWHSQGLPYNYYLAFVANHLSFIITCPAAGPVNAVGSPFSLYSGRECMDAFSVSGKLSYTIMEYFLRPFSPHR